MNLVETRKHLFKKMVQDWYAFSTVNLIRYKFYLPLDALKGTVGLLHLVTRQDASRFLHCLWAPIDYASSPAEPRLYGLRNTISST